jgi:hypothetical protein
MNTLKTIVTIIFCTVLLVSVSSCAVILEPANYGKHNGWYKNSNNPHHHNGTNPGHFKDDSKHHHKNH